MPHFLIRFPRPVVYLPDHPRGRRETDQLIVSAESPDLALIHAYRTVTGDPTGATVELYIESMGAPPVAEAPVDSLIEIHVQGI